MHGIWSSHTLKHQITCKISKCGIRFIAPKRHIRYAKACEITRTIYSYKNKVRIQFLFLEVKKIHFPEMKNKRKRKIAFVVRSKDILLTRHFPLHSHFKFMPPYKDGTHPMPTTNCTRSACMNIHSWACQAIVQTIYLPWDVHVTLPTPIDFYLARHNEGLKPRCPRMVTSK